MPESAAPLVPVATASRATVEVVAVLRKIDTQATTARALVAMASESSGTRPRCPTMAVSARLYSGSAAIDPSAGMASIAIRRSSSCLGLPVTATSVHKVTQLGQTGREPRRVNQSERFLSCPYGKLAPVRSQLGIIAWLLGLVLGTVDWTDRRNG
jgi:hypothetical protein